MKKNDWLVIAMLFSGRRNPQWHLSEKQAEHFSALWNQAITSNNEVIIPSILGYRGIKLTTEEKKWLIYNGIITCEERGKKFSKTDTGQTIEKFLLSTAPKEIYKLLQKINLI